MTGCKSQVIEKLTHRGLRSAISGEALLFCARGAGPGGDVRFRPTPLIFRSGRSRNSTLLAPYSNSEQVAGLHRARQPSASLDERMRTPAPFLL